MGDLLGGASRKTSAAPARSSEPEPATKTGKALAVIRDNAPGFIGTTVATAREAGEWLAPIDRVMNKLPLVPYVPPVAPSSQERFTAAGMGVLYTIAGGFNAIPVVNWVIGPAVASATVAIGGGLAKFKSDNPEVQNQANLALQTTVYGLAGNVAGCGVVPIGSLAYFRAAGKSFATFFRKAKD